MAEGSILLAEQNLFHQHQPESQCWSLGLFSVACVSGKALAAGSLHVFVYHGTGG